MVSASTSVDMKPDPPKSPQLNIFAPSGERLPAADVGEHRTAKVFEKFCCCFSIRTMTFVIAAFSMIASLTTLLELGRLKCTPGVPAGAVGGFVMVHLLFLLASLLVAGADQGRRALMKPWLFLQALKLISLLSFAGYLFMDHSTPRRLLQNLPKGCEERYLPDNYSGPDLASQLASHHLPVTYLPGDDDVDAGIIQATEAHQSHPNDQDSTINNLASTGMNETAAKNIYRHPKPTRKPLTSSETSSISLELEEAMKRQDFAVWAVLSVFAIELYFTIVVVYRYFRYAKKEDNFKEVVDEFGAGYFQMTTRSRSGSGEAGEGEGGLPPGNSHRRSLHLQVRRGSDASSVVEGGSDVQIVITSSEA